MKFWYAISTKGHCETFAAASLEHLGVEVFLPMLKEKRIARGQWHTSRVPLFPGYLFAQFDITSQFRTVAYAKGVRKIVSLGGCPSIVDEAIICAIRAQATDGAVELPASRFSPGQVVRIQDGPLFGLEAVFEKKLSGTTRAVLLLKAISYQARVIVDSRQVANL